MTWQDLSQTWHYVEQWAREIPDAEALVFEKDRLTWSGFKSEMDKAARSPVRKVTAIFWNKTEPAQTKNWKQGLASFLPRGLFGILYWYAMFPAHQWLFEGMLKRVAQKTGMRVVEDPEAFKAESSVECKL